MKTGRDVVADAYLALAEEAGDASRVNLRETARRLGCAHTNIYNYYPRMADLKWAALERALVRLTDYTETSLKGCGSKEDRLRRFIGSQIEFALDHPALYRLIWVDSLEGTPPASLEALSRRTAERFTEETASGPLGKREAALIHDALHGRCLKLIMGRFDREKGELIEPLTEELLFLRRALRSAEEDKHE